jgi:predicted Na+-dependent transporter
MARGLFLVVVVPVMVGQLLRRLATLRATVDHAKPILSVVCRLLILTIIVKASVDAKINLDRLGESWSGTDLVVVAVACAAAHTFLLFFGYLLGRRLFSHEEAIGIAISGSQKTLPVGAYLISAYYAAFPLSIVPMLFYHVGQLIIDTYVSDQFFYSKPVPIPQQVDEDEEPTSPEIEDEPVAET